MRSNVKVMHKSMKSFKEHVSQVHHNIPLDFIFPILLRDWVIELAAIHPMASMQAVENKKPYDGVKACTPYEI